jgi:hypothetical protein
MDGIDQGMDGIDTEKNRENQNLSHRYMGFMGFVKTERKNGCHTPSKNPISRDF